MADYLNGTPCRHGHDGKRYAKNNKCVECVRLNNQSQDRAKNRDRVNAWRRGRPEYNKMAAARWRANNPQKNMLAIVRQRARSEGMDFNLTLEDIVIPELCPVFGIPMDVPSVDRIDSSKGYVKGNVCVISLQANRMKQDSTIEQLKQIIAYMEREGGLLAQSPL